MIFRSVNIERLAWWTLAMNLVVIVQGAIVRATGSGAGCGSHWPTCHGEVVPLNHTTESLIEFSHRSLSLVVLLLGLWLLMRAWGLRRERPGFMFFAATSFVFVVIEALLGAATVLFGLTGDNVSTARGVMVASHLVNSVLLVGALTATVVYARRDAPGWPLRLAGQPAVATSFALGLALMLVLMFSGGIAAMGNTMFPSETLAEGVAADFDADSHPLVRLRILHPIIAISVGIYLFLALGFARLRKPLRQGQGLSRALLVVFLVQFVVGAVNFALLAPILLQLLHLGLAVASFALFAALMTVTLGHPAGQAANQSSQSVLSPLENPQA